MSLKSNLGRNVRAYRKIHRWSLKELAALSGIDQGSLSRLERGLGGHSTESVSRLCKAFGISEGQLFADDNPEDNRMLEFRRIPVLKEALIPAYAKDREIVEQRKYVEYIAVDKANSYEAFGFRPDAAGMRPLFDEGDLVVVDPAVETRPGDFVIAVGPRSSIIFGQFKVTGESDDGINFELVPLNSFYPVISSTAQAVEIVGTVTEHRRFFKIRRLNPLVVELKDVAWFEK